MAYVPLFVQKAKVISKVNKPWITAISDEDLESAELRIMIDLAEPIEPIGIGVTAADLLACNSGIFGPMLEQAAMFACMAELNANGVGNVTVGPIVSAQGDGMAKTHSYYTGKKTDVNSLVTAEERYLRLIRAMLRRYKALCLGRRENYRRVNPFYAEGYNINSYDNRRTDGNPTG